MKTYILRLCLLLMPLFSVSQNSVTIDGRLQPLLNEFFAQCDTYGIEFNEKLFQLKSIDITDSLPLEENNTVMGMVTRDTYGNIESILINWIALIDPEVLKVVAFHEFAHHFLDYKHTCADCNEIMAVNNNSYFNVAKDWENQVNQLFVSSPVYLAIQQKNTLVLNK